jgi:hypothetical protein
MTDIPKHLRRLVQERAQGKCEYCLIHEDFVMAPHEPDHILSEKHAGATTAENLAWACTLCNRFKGSDVGSFDPLSQKFVPLFNPRAQHWHRHFKLNGAVIEPVTASGRVTVFLLRFNDIARVDDRAVLIESEDYP